MVLTEQEAREAQCIGPGNCGKRAGGSAGHVRRLCVGSECKMAWRWAEKQPCGMGYDGRGTPQDSNALGYCGLAGRHER